MQLENSSITEENIRAVVRFPGDISAVDAALDEKRRHFMTNPARFIGTDPWFQSRSPLMTPAKQPVHACQNRDGLGNERARKEIAADLKISIHTSPSARSGVHSQSPASGTAMEWTAAENFTRS